MRLKISSTALLLFSCLSLAVLFSINDLSLADDQITYWYSAKEIIVRDFSVRYWNPSNTFSYLLATSYLLTQNVEFSFLIIFGCVSFLYCYAMTVCLKSFLESELLSVGVALISMIPVYTLAMTYWGFGSFDMIRGRILVMPIAPLIILWFYKSRHSKKVWMPLVICSLAGAIHLEIIYLSMILSATLLWLNCAKESNRKILTQTLHFIVLSGLAACCVFFIPKFLANTLGDNPIAHSYHWLGIAHEHYSGYIQSLSHSDYIQLRWESAREAFWWAMFPPRITDLLYVIAGSFFLLLFGGLGLAEVRRKNRELFRFILVFAAATFVVAYGHQVFRYVGRYLWGASPSIWEEVRAVKFVYFFIYLSIGFLFKKWMVEKKYGVIVMACVLIVFSPIQMLTMLPMRWKENLATQTSRVFTQSYLTEYFRKALKIPDINQERDLKSIERIFAEVLKKDALTYVLTDIHSLKQSGVVTLISYQDKRIGKSQRNRESALPYWYLAYQEISRTLRSGNADEVLQTANKYRCEWIVSYQKLSAKNLAPHFEGKKLFLYQVKNNPLKPTKPATKNR